MKLLIDTQILIYLVIGRDRLTPRERKAIGVADELCVSTVSLFELRIKRRAERRRQLPFTVIAPAEAIAFCDARRITIHPLLPEDTAAELDEDTPHRDPFDEMLIAHALTLGARLLTRDDKLRRHPLAYRP